VVLLEPDENTKSGLEAGQVKLKVTNPALLRGPVIGSLRFKVPGKKDFFIIHRG
jgi:hypothetical protein